MRHDPWNHAPHERELAEGPWLVGECENRHLRAVRRDDAGAEAALREDDDDRRAEHSLRGIGCRSNRLLGGRDYLRSNVPVARPFERVLLYLGDVAVRRFVGEALM